MESASLPNCINASFLLAKTIHILEELAEEEDFYVDWAIDGSLDMDDTARSEVIISAEDMPYVYYSLYSEREAQLGGSLILFYGCDSVDIDESELVEIGKTIRIKFACACLNVSWDGSPYSGIEISHSKASLRELDADASMMASIYLNESTANKYPEVYQRHYPNECLDDNGDPPDCVNIYLILNEAESVKSAVSRLLPEIDASDIVYYCRCFDNGETIQPLEQISKWQDSEL